MTSPRRNLMDLFIPQSPAQGIIRDGWEVAAHVVVELRDGESELAVGRAVDDALADETVAEGGDLWCRATELRRPVAGSVDARAEFGEGAHVPDLRRRDAGEAGGEEGVVEGALDGRFGSAHVGRRYRVVLRHVPRVVAPGLEEVRVAGGAAHDAVDGVGRERHRE